MAIRPKAPPPIEVYEPRRFDGRTRCKICDSYPDICKWIRDSLIATHKAGALRWPKETLRKRVNLLFAPALVANSVMGRHLEEHEPAWRLWDGEADA